MNARQFRYILVLAAEGSFSKAAKTLNISQPSLSQYVKKIENQVGMPLFDRTNNEVRLTDAGRVYIEAGRKILDIEHQMEGQISDLMENKTGTIIIGTAPYRASGMMPAVAARFQALHPGMHLVIREGTTVELEEGMEHGEFDLCLTMLPVDPLLFEYEIVREEELLLAVPAGWPPLEAEKREGRKYPVVNVQALSGQRLVLQNEGQFMQDQLERILTEYRLSIQPAVVVKSLEAKIEMVKAGVGMALVPSGIEHFCAHGEVEFYEFDEALPKRELAVMWRKGQPLSETAKELKAILLQ